MHCSAITLGRPCHSRAVSTSPYCAHHQKPPLKVPGGGDDPVLADFEQPSSTTSAGPEPIPSPVAGEGAGGEGNNAEAMQSHAELASTTNAEQSTNNVNSISAGFRNCQATTHRGIKCRFPPSRGETLCINHRQGADAAAATAKARAARVARRTKPSIDLLTTVIALNDRTSIQAVLDEVIRLSLAGRIDFKRARIVLQACAIAVRNFDPAPITLSGPKPQQHDWESYFGRVKAALLTIDPLLEQADQQDNPEKPDETPLSEVCNNVC